MKAAVCPGCHRKRLVFSKGTQATGLYWVLRRHKDAYPARKNFSERVALNDICLYSGRRVSEDRVVSLW